MGDRTLVLLSPIGSDERCWDALPVDRLGYPGTVERVLFPGQGDEPRQPGMTFESLADGVAGRLEGELDVVGLAVGASIASQLLLRHPERVRSTVLVSAGFTKAAPPEERERIVARGRRGLEHGMASIVDEMAERWFTLHARLSGHPAVRYSRETLLATDPEGWVDLWKTVAARNSVPRERAEAIAQPVSLVGPVHDFTGGFRNVAALHGVLPRTRLQYIDGPHMVHLERPLDLLAALDQHFVWVEDGGRRIDTPLYSSGS